MIKDSQLNMIPKNGGKQLSEEAIYGRLNYRHFAASDYLNNLSNWENNFLKENIYIGFYDQLRDDPVSFLNGIYGFLDVTLIAENQNQYDLGKKVNPGAYKGIPSEIQKALAQKYRKDIIQIHERFDNKYTARWVLKHEQYS